MKRTYLFGTMMAFSLAAASVGAQQDRPTSASEQPSKNVVVTGCLKSGSSPTGSTATGSTATGTAGTTGTSGTTASGSSFILADAKVTPATGAASASGTTGSTAGTTGTSGTAPSASADKDKAKSFALVGGTSSELQGYINSKVEITGTIDPSASGSAASGSASSPSTTGATASMAGMSHAGDAAKLRVTSVRQVAASCDPAQR